MARISLRPGPLYINVHADLAASTVSGLEQGYVVCPSEGRFLLLFTFLKRNANKKCIVFMSSCNSVKYHSELLNYIDVPVLDLHGKQKQQKRTSTFFEFCNAPKGTLLCTDVAARGLDIPKVDWIIQFDPPDDPRDYIHRVGRTARAGKAGRSLLFLLPSELGFLRFLKVAKVPLNEYSFPKSKVANVQGQLEKLISSNYYLHQSALEGYRSYLQAYASYSLKRIFDVHSIDLAAVGRAFGFKVPPKVNIGIGGSLKGRSSSSQQQQQQQHQNGKRKDAEVDADEAGEDGPVVNDGNEGEEEAEAEMTEVSRKEQQDGSRRAYKKAKGDKSNGGGHGGGHGGSGGDRSGRAGKAVDKYRRAEQASRGMKKGGNWSR